MLFDLAGSALLFFVLALGLAWPITMRLALEPGEKLLATVSLSLLGLWLVAWANYVTGLPRFTIWILPALAIAGAGFGWRAGLALWREPGNRELLFAQLLVTAWSVGWLALVVSYSGGGWAADWFEHWERSRFFIERWPHDTLFLGLYPLPARPPLANVITGAFLQLTRVDFAHYQLVSTLLASLAFLPPAVLARRFGGGKSVAVLTGLFMANPLFIQNATFPWTKLPATFFILTAVVFFLRAREASRPAVAVSLFAALLAAGLLAHYSAGPYLAVLVTMWLFEGWSRRTEQSWRRHTVLAILVGGLVLSSWFAWSLATFGLSGTFLTNTTVTTQDTRALSQLAKVALNLRDTLVPHFLREFDLSLITQRDVWGACRDWFFQSYQVNLFFAFGSVAWLGVLFALKQAAREASPVHRRFWSAFVTGVVLLGIAVHGKRDHWGLAHICLQPLVLLGLALLAGRWSTLSAAWRRMLIAGATIDCTFGIVLHFGIQGYLLDHWLGLGRGVDRATADYNGVAGMNLAAKHHWKLEFINDALSVRPELVLALLAALLTVAIMRARGVPNR